MAIDQSGSKAVGKFEAPARITWKPRALRRLLSIELMDEHTGELGIVMGLPMAKAHVQLVNHAVWRRWWW